MAGSHNLRVCTLALWGLCLLAATSLHFAGAGPGDAPAAGEPPAAVGLLSRAPGDAVIPARVADELRAASQAAPLRLLLLSAVLALLLGLPAVLRTRLSPAGPGSQPLRARRHTIALRAPPLRFA